MSTLRLTLACGPYDRTEALATGIVRPEGIDLIYVPIQSPPELFARALSGAFDVAEMSCAHYLIHRGKGDFPFVAIPVFPSRMFRHGYVFVNTGAGIRAPGDLEEKRVGVPEYSQTAAVWIRGWLSDEYGVRPETIRWYSGGVNAAGRPDILVNPPDAPVSITRVADRTLNDLLVEGEIDALLGARKPAAFGRDPRVQRLFPNYRELERAYYKATGIFPIMHTVVIRDALYREHPWVADSLYKAFAQAKAWSLAQMRFSSSLRYTLPWLHAELEETTALFGPDPWPYGIEPNRRTLDALVRYLAEQGFLSSPPQIERLFAPVIGIGE